MESFQRDDLCTKKKKNVENGESERPGVQGCHVTVVTGSGVGDIVIKGKERLEKR